MHKVRGPTTKVLVNEIGPSEIGPRNLGHGPRHGRLSRRRSSPSSAVLHFVQPWLWAHSNMASLTLRGSRRRSGRRTRSHFSLNSSILFQSSYDLGTLSKCVEGSSVMSPRLDAMCGFITSNLCAIFLPQQLITHVE